MNPKKYYRQTVVAVVFVTAVLLCSQVNAQSPRMAVSGDEIISGGPSSAEAQQALQNRINQQSEGRIKLLNFKPTMTKLVKQDRRGHCEFGFEAQIEFSEPCQWAIQFGGESLTFKTTKPNEAIASVGSNGVITVSEKGEDYTAFGSILFIPGTNGWTLSGFASSENPKLTAELSDKRCILNLRYISAAFAQYELEHNGRNPFNISTNSGGTLELCSRDADGTDKNSYLHYKVVSDFFQDAGVLVCPADSSKTAIRHFQGLINTSMEMKIEKVKEFNKITATNVTYLLHSSVDIDNTGQPRQILAVCPIHGYVLYTDGEIKKK